MERLKRILSECYCDGALYTHVLLSGGKVNIGSNRARDFWNHYMKCVNEGGHVLCLAEKPLGELPILVDIDLKTRVKKSTISPFSLYNDSEIQIIVETYQKALHDDILAGVPRDALLCVLLEKNPRFEEKNGIKFVKHGFHLHFPKCFVDVAVQKAYLIPIVRQQLKGMFDRLYTVDDGHCDPENDGSREKCKTLTEISSTDDHYNFIDDTTKAPWILYGSQKPNGTPYVATRCFDGFGKEIDFEEGLGDYVLPKLRGQDTATDCRGRVIELLPRILSTKLHGRIEYYYKSKPTVNTPAVDEFASVRLKRTVFIQKTITENLNEAERLIDMIAAKRADSRSDWLTIGFCLHNITEGDEAGLSLWLEFSSQSDKYNEAECICKWQDEMKENNYTIGTLKYFAKSDSPEKYEEYCKEKGNILIEKAVEGGHNDMARMLYNAYSEEFVYAPGNPGAWFYFNNIWNKGFCYPLSQRISDNNGVIISQFNSHIDAAKAELRKLGVNSVTKPKRRTKKTDESFDDEEEEDIIRIDMLKNKISKLEKLIKQCKNHTFKSQVMKECQEVFRDEHFIEKLNKNPYLVAFKNGVYDFTTDTFRPGKPEDCLSVSTAIDYIDYGSVDHVEVMKICEFFQKVIPDKEVRDYFLNQTCQLFIGGNHDKVFFIWTGSGNNGKSVTQKLFEKMLGKLAVKISTTLITGKKTSIGQATPELARTGNGVRWLVMDEPEKGEKITTGVLKAITGNDSFYARGLYQDGQEICPLFKLVMLCNDLPVIQNPDDAAWDRFRVIPFESKFVGEGQYPTSYEEQVATKTFPDDPHFGKKIDSLLQPFAYYLIYHLRQINSKNVKIPDKVRIATNMYKEENNDPMKDFIEDEIQPVTGGELSVDEMCTRYREWWKVNYPGDKLTATKNLLIAGFAKYLGEVETSTTRGGIKKKIIKGYEWRKSIETRVENPML